MFLLYVQRASIGSVRSAEYVDDSTAALVHALIASRVDYCYTVLAGAPRTIITDRFQQVLNASVRMVSGTRKFDRGLSQLPHSELHWLDIPQRVQYKLGVTVHRCLAFSIDLRGRLYNTLALPCEYVISIFFSVLLLANKYVPYHWTDGHCS